MITCSDDACSTRGRGERHKQGFVKAGQAVLLANPASELPQRPQAVLSPEEVESVLAVPQVSTLARTCSRCSSNWRLGTSSADRPVANTVGRTSCAKDDEGRTMQGMRVKATVVGNTLVVDNDVHLPEGARVEADLQMLETDGVEVDADTAAELELAHQEADAGDFVSEEEVFANLAARRRK